VTEGESTDFEFVKDQIFKDAEKFDLREMNVDRWQAHQMASQLGQEGITVLGIGQGFQGMGLPTKELERRLLRRKINHGGNPVLRWMADNVSVKQDPAGNLKPDREASQGKIDGIVGIIGALDRLMLHEDTTSIYEGRGMLSV